MTLLFSLFTLLLLFLITMLVTSQDSPVPPLNAAEQEAVYRVLESINSEISWRSEYPDDLCYSAPHGVVCDIFTDDQTGLYTTHITELSFGYVSDYSANPPCSTTATLNSALFKPLTHLRKLFFYKCFTQNPVNFPDFSSVSSLEELIYIENPALVGSISGSIGKLSSLRRLVLTGTNVSGSIPHTFDYLTNLEQLTLSRNKFNGTVSMTFENLKKLKIVDFSQNKFAGKVPESIGNLTQLLKLDLSFNAFSGKIPETLKYLKTLQFLDLSYNKFGNFGIPLFLGEMSSLTVVYLSGNYLGGVIPEIWEKLGGIIGLGLSSTGVIGEIPASMGVHLKKACYIGLDNNKLEGTVPKEFEGLEFVNELNLENNNLTGKVPFSAEFVSRLKEKLKLEGNTELCVDGSLQLGRLKVCSQENDVAKSDLVSGGSKYPRGSYLLLLFGFLFLYI